MRRRLPHLLPPLGNYISWREPLINVRGFSDPLGTVTSEVGGVAMRIGGVGVGYLVGNASGFPGGGLIGAVIGYLVGAGISRFGGEEA